MFHHPKWRFRHAALEQACSSLFLSVKRESTELQQSNTWKLFCVSHEDFFLFPFRPPFLCFHSLLPNPHILLVSFSSVVPICQPSVFKAACPIRIQVLSDSLTISEHSPLSSHKTLTHFCRLLPPPYPPRPYPLSSSLRVPSFCFPMYSLSPSFSLSLLDESRHASRSLF